MSSQLSNVVFILWRESVEALLVIGILSAWLSQQDNPLSITKGRRYLWAGVGAGLALALIFAAVLVVLGDSLPDDAQQIYQAVTVLIASALIVQMVFWMRRHGRTLKRDLESALTKAASQESWWSVFILAMIAVAREGSETAVFIYGTLSAGKNDSLLATLGAIALGAALAACTYLLLQLGNRYLSWRVFFRMTEIMLLLLAGALLVTGIDNLVSLDYLPALSGRLWDTSTILPDRGIVGGLLASLTGYRAKPFGMEILVLALYWLAIYFAIRAPSAPIKQAIIAK